jgi:hypothetical protein
MFTALTPLSTSALAQAALGTVSNFSVNLVDLDLNDGISPTLTLTPSSSWVAALYYAQGTGSPDASNIIYTSGSAAISIPAGSATAFLGDANAFASAALNSTTGEITATSTQIWDFQLSAHTSLTLTAFAFGDQRTANGQTSSQVFISYADAATPYPTYLSDQLYVYQGLSGRLLSVAISTGADGLSGQLGFSARAEARAVTPVPEPAPYALLGAGLALLGGLRKVRRRAHARTA